MRPSEVLLVGKHVIFCDFSNISCPRTLGRFKKSGIPYIDVRHPLEFRMYLASDVLGGGWSALVTQAVGEWCGLDKRCSACTL